MAIFQHPQDAEEMVEGRELQLGEVVEEGDVYTDSMTKKWLAVPPIFIGVKVPKDPERKGVIVRPINLSQQQ